MVFPDDRADLHEELIKNFKCLCCGNCCRGDGFVRVTPEEMAAMVAVLGIDLDRFIAEYTREPQFTWHKSAGDRWLANHADKPLDCIFLVDNKCIVQKAKPRQCREFPYDWRHQDMLDDCAGYRKFLEERKKH